MFKNNTLIAAFILGISSLVLAGTFFLNNTVEEAQADATICTGATIINGFCYDDTGTAGGIVKIVFTDKSYYTPQFGSGDLNYISSEGLKATVTRKHQTNVEDLIVMNDTAFNLSPGLRNANDYWGGCQISSASEGDADGKTYDITCAEPANGAGSKAHFVFIDSVTLVETFYTIDLLSNDHSYSTRQINGVDRQTDDTITIRNNDKFQIDFGTETPVSSSFNTKATVSHTVGMELTLANSSTEDLFGCSNGTGTKTGGTVIPAGVDDCVTSSPLGSEELDFCFDPKGLTGSFTFTFGIGTGGTESEFTMTVNIVGAGGEVAAGCGTPANVAPVANTVNATVPSDNNNTIAIELSGADENSDALTFTPGALTGTGSLSGVTGVVTNGTVTTGSIDYTPAVNMEAGDVASFTYTVYDGTDTSAPATVTITKASATGSSRNSGRASIKTTVPDEIDYIDPCIPAYSPIEGAYHNAPEEIVIEGLSEDAIKDYKEFSDAYQEIDPHSHYGAYLEHVLDRGDEMALKIMLDKGYADEDF